MSYVNYDYVVDQLRDAGLEIDLPLELAKNEKSVRCRIAGGDHEKRGWYRLYEHLIDNDLYLVGSYGAFQGDDAGTRKIELTRRCDKCGASVPLRDKQCPACGSKKIRKAELSEEQKAALAARLAADKKRAAAERQAEQDRASQWASAVWRASKPVEQPDDHDYLPRKGLKSGGGARIFPGNDGVNLVDAAREDHEYLNSFKGALVIPIMDTTGRVFSLQFILSRKHHGERIRRTERDKEYWPGGDGTIKGHYFLIGPSPAGVVLIAEGFATGLTLSQVTGLPVAVAFAANNIGPVAGALKKHYRKAKQLICADDDWLQKCAECKAWTPVADGTCSACGKPHRKLNAGVQRASEAALVSGAAWIKPEFATPRPVDRKGPTDFNDLAELEGEAIVRAQLEKALAALKVAPNSAAVPEKTARENAASSGGGERRRAESVMSVDDLVERYIPLDDGTGDYVFDTWTNKVAKRAQMLTLLPAGARGDDIKRHPLWVQRGAFYLDQVGFDPSGNDRNVKLNTWQGWPLRPKRGECGMLLDLLDYLCSEEANREEVYQWILCWMAYPLQNPGAKMSSAIIMHGPQGTGKSTVFQTLAKIYGDYATVLNQRGLEDKFNSDWSDSKLFILAEEVVTRAEMWHIKNELKELVTGEWIRINPKNIAAYRQRNQVNIAYLSNENQPLPIDNDDRRHLVVYTPPARDASFYDDVFLELENGGVEAFYDYLMRVDISGFHPKKRPPMTESKQALIDLSLPSEAIFVREWAAGHIDSGAQALPFGPCSGAQLHAAYARWARSALVHRARDLTQFIGYVGRLPGWVAGKAFPTYESIGATTRKNRKMVIPSDAALADAMKTTSGHVMKQGEGQSQQSWLTECFFKFQQALEAGQ
jgi:putative DNA primase/helicase